MSVRDIAGESQGDYHEVDCRLAQEAFKGRAVSSTFRASKTWKKTKLSEKSGRTVQPGVHKGQQARCARHCCCWCSRHQAWNHGEWQYWLQVATSGHQNSRCLLGGGEWVQPSHWIGPRCNRWVEVYQRKETASRILQWNIDRFRQVLLWCKRNYANIRIWCHRNNHHLGKSRI